jgi:hypothetical protein
MVFIHANLKLTDRGSCPPTIPPLSQAQEPVSDQVKQKPQGQLVIELNRYDALHL